MPSRNPHGGPRKGAGRPPTGKPRRVTASISIDPALLAHADATGNRSQYIETLIRRDKMITYALVEVKETMVSAGGGASLVSRHDLIVMEYSAYLALPCDVCERECHAPHQKHTSVPQDTGDDNPPYIETDYTLRGEFNTRDEAINALVETARDYIFPQQFDEVRIRRFGDASLPC